MTGQMIIPPLIWVTDKFGEHYKWKDCIDRNIECDIYTCQEALMCDALTLPYEGDRSKELIKEIL